MALILLALGAVGHAVLWIVVINRIHALGIRRRLVNLVTVFSVAMLLIAPVGVAIALGWGLTSASSVEPGAGDWGLVESNLPRLSASATHFAAGVAWGYIVLCAAVCVASTIQRWQWFRHPERSVAHVTNDTSEIRLAESSGPLTARGIPTWLSRLPGNQVLKICIQEKELVIPRLAAEHDGLQIAHVTDLHMSGRLTRAYFEHVVAEVNRAAADIVAITGDIVEGDQFLAWLPATLGQLRARFGVYYVLGNHDRRANESRLKAALADAGIIHVGGTWRRIIVNDAPLILAGNELPWYKPAADMSDCPEHGPAGGPTRVLLAHSPDQFRWAQANDVDLMLAGHLHGGQIRLPLMGAITSPSVHGVRYVAGVFTAGNTVMHVSRGVSSLTPVRFNCPPEVAILKLATKNPTGWPARPH